MAASAPGTVTGDEVAAGKRVTIRFSSERAYAELIFNLFSTPELGSYLPLMITASGSLRKHVDFLAEKCTAAALCGLATSLTFERQARQRAATSQLPIDAILAEEDARFMAAVSGAIMPDSTVEPAQPAQLTREAFEDARRVMRPIPSQFTPPNINQPWPDLRQVLADNMRRDLQAEMDQQIISASNGIPGATLVGGFEAINDMGDRPDAYAELRALQRDIPASELWEIMRNGDTAPQMLNVNMTVTTGGFELETTEFEPEATYSPETVDPIVGLRDVLPPAVFEIVDGYSDQPVSDWLSDEGYEFVDAIPLTPTSVNHYPSSTQYATTYHLIRAEAGGGHVVLEPGDLLVNHAGYVFEVVVADGIMTFRGSKHGRELPTHIGCRHITTLLLPAHLANCLAESEQLLCPVYRPAHIRTRLAMTGQVDWCRRQLTQSRASRIVNALAEAPALINAYTRQRISEEGFLRRILPPMAID